MTDAFARRDAERTQGMELRVRSPAAMIVRRFMRHRMAVFSLFMLGLVVASALLAPLGRYTPTEQDPQNAFMPPSAEHWFGTDDLGRDVFTRTLYGGRISLTVGLAATGLALALGVLVGAVAGYGGNWLDNLLMRLTDAFLSLPSLFVLILISTMLRDMPVAGLRNSVGIVILIIAVLSWMWPARLVRGAFLSLREQEFVHAARSVGAKDRRIMFSHILPNTVSLILVQGTLSVGYAIIVESGLSYLGFGVQPPTPSWGNLLATAQVYALRAPWLMIFPGLMIFITTLSINHIGDGLRDAFDPFSIRQ